MRSNYTTRHRTAGTHHVLNELKTQAETIGGDVADLGAIVKGAAQSKLQDLQRTSAAMYAQGQVKLRDRMRNLEAYVKTQPMKSLAIAAAVGMILGRVFRR